jgi:hypothetical protein
MPAANTERYYGDLPPFSDFAGIAALGDYHPVPDDWTVMITDVVSSTRAIAEGRYKDVNFIGAATITAILNIARNVSLPFAFGGDGGLVLVPPRLVQPARDALAALRKVSADLFGLDLRAAAIPVADLRVAGAELAVRRFELTRGNFLAMFSGGGIQLAERWLKDADAAAPYLIPPADSAPDLDGLSCRWEKLVPRGGRMMALIIRGTDQSEPAMRSDIARTMQAISDLIGGDPQQAAPVSDFSLRFRWPPSGIINEAKLHPGRFGSSVAYLRLLGISLLQWASQVFNRRVGAYDPAIYRRQLALNTDFRKFDGTLRLVLDVTEAQASAIEDWLDGEYRAGRLVYGSHVADHGLMTCLVFSLAANQHVHFVDNAEGGFALAAAAFKQRLDRLPGNRAGQGQS